jgi:hypothetical protein
VENVSHRYRQPVGTPPCAVVCMDCANTNRLERYTNFQKTVPVGKFVIFLEPGEAKR